MQIDKTLMTGVYVIRNIINQKVYVGSSATGFENRWRWHRNDLNLHVHCNRHLQAAWGKYGEENFVFEIVQRCLPERCIEREQLFMDFFDATDDRYGYNLCPTAGSMFGFKMSCETKKKMSTSSRGRKRSQESIDRAVAKNKGRKRSPEQKARMKAAQNKPETRTKRSNSLKGRIMSAAHRANLSKAMTGHLAWNRGKVMNERQTEKLRKYVASPCGREKLLKAAENGRIAIAKRAELKRLNKEVVC